VKIPGHFYFHGAAVTDHPADDLLSRYRKSCQIDEQQYAAGRRWRTLVEAVAFGDRRAQMVLDGLSYSFDREWCERRLFEREMDEEHGRRRATRKGSSYKRALATARFCRELLSDVLIGSSGETAGGLTKLQQAADKYGMNSTTGSRDMKKLGRYLRFSLSVLSCVFKRTDESRPPAPIAPTFMSPLYLGGVGISSPRTDEHDEPIKIERVQMLARKMGFHVAWSDKGDGFDVWKISGSYGELTNFRNRTLHEIEAALKRTLAKQLPRRKPGARGRAPVTLAKHA